MADDPPRRRGRPRLDPDGPPAEPVYVRITAGDYHKAHALAGQHRESIQDVIRRGLRNELRRARALPRYEYLGPAIKIGLRSR